MPGFERFLALPGLEEISLAVHGSVHGPVPVLYLVITSFGSMALLARATDRPKGLVVESFRHDALTLDDLDDLLVERQDGEAAAGGYLIDQFRMSDTPGLEGRKYFERRLEAVNSRLGAWFATWVGELGTRGIREVALVAGGRLALLPLHSVTVRSEPSTCLLDEMQVRYLPSARFARPSPSAGLAAAKNSPARLVVVGHGGAESAELPYTSSELRVVEAAFPGDAIRLQGPGATKAAVEEALDGASYLHLACHGGFDVARPLDSGLDLADGRWTMRRILELAPRLESLQLVALSACQTGLSEWNRLPDELIGLPAAFLQAGVRGVIATLWPAEDLATVLLMEMFYQRLFAPDPMPPDRALRAAQLGLRDLEVGELNERFRGSRSDAESAPDPLSEVGYQMLGRLRPYGLAAKPFTDSYWAPFYYIGA